MDRSETPAVTQRVELAMDADSARMRLPFDLLLDPDTGPIDLPPADGDTELEADAKLQCSRFGRGPTWTACSAPAPDETLSPSSPDSTRLGLTIGGRIHLPKVMSIDLFYEHLRLLPRESTSLDAPQASYGGFANVAGVSLTLHAPVEGTAHDPESLVVQYNTVMKDYVAVPDAFFADGRVDALWARMVTNARALPPRPTNPKKK